MNDKGRAGEEQAAAYLTGKGYTILARNYRGQSGEIDIIASNSEHLNFVEVKNWDSFSVENLEFSLNRKKRNKILKTAMNYLQNNPKLINSTMRFDIIFIDRRGIHHIEEAFTADG